MIGPVSSQTEIGDRARHSLTVFSMKSWQYVDIGMTAWAQIEIASVHVRESTQLGSREGSKRVECDAVHDFD